MADWRDAGRERCELDMNDDRRDGYCVECGSYEDLDRDGYCPACKAELNRIEDEASLSANSPTPNKPTSEGAIVA